jgi:hypothetical protein
VSELKLRTWQLAGEDIAAPEVAEEAAPAAETEQEAAEETQSDEPAESVSEVEISTVAASVEDVMVLEQEYMSKYGRYLHVMPGNTLPAYESGSVQEKLGKTIPENYNVEVYESPHGKGYQISYEENGIVHSVGYGPEAADRTYTFELLKPPVSATSTQVVE